MVTGSVTVAPMKPSYAYALGETITLTATPYAKDSFIRWSGDLKGAANPASLTMDGNKTVRATFSPAVPIPPGVIALWRGETDASDLIGSTRPPDMIRTFHHGAFYDGTGVIAPSVTASGKVGGAFDFNSAPPFNGTVHVQVPDSPALKPAQLTVEAWVFPTARSPQPQTIVAKGSTWRLQLDPAVGHPEFRFQGNSVLQGALPIPLNEWTHLAFTFEESAFCLYVDGAIVASRDDLIVVLVYDPTPPPIPVTIGSGWVSNASSALFNGRIDEVTLYNRALTADEILAT
jgi:Concanavalin A-like lectin/glucanases superfamily/Divergent InlB B-repeat domain